MAERDGYRPYLYKQERQWIYERDGVEDPAEYELHHIVPVLYAVALLGLAREEINAPENLIALPKPEHRAIHKPPHEIGNWIETEEPYWHTERDDELKQIAQERTQAFESQGNIFPGRRRV